MAVLGNNLLIYSDGTLIAGTKSNDVVTECDLIGVSSPSAAEWKEFRAGRKGWSVTVNFLLALNTDVSALLTVGNSYTLHFFGGGTTLGVYGDAICTTCRITATCGNLVQGSFRFVGNGELTGDVQPLPPRP